MSQVRLKEKKEDGSKFDSLMQKNWTMGLFTRSQNANTKNPAGRTPLAILDRKASLTEAQWNEAQTQLNSAMPAFDKCEKDGLKFLQIVGTENKEDPLYQSLQLGCTYFTFGAQVTFPNDYHKLGIVNYHKYLSQVTQGNYHKYLSLK